MAGGGTGSKLAAANAFRSRDYVLYQTARLLVVLGAEAQSVAVAWHVYQITHSALALGCTGLALFVPGLFFVLPAGHVADRYDRRTVLLVCYTLQAICSAGLLLLGLHSSEHIWPIYLVLFGIGTGRAFSGPASSALLPSLIPKEHFVNAVTWGATVFQVANIAGPALGGILFTLRFSGAIGRWNGPSIVYAFTVLTLCSYLILIGMIRPKIVVNEKKAFSLETMLAGLAYVWKTKLLLGSISLDLFAVLLGGAVALLPIFSEDILHAGPRGLGLLRAMPSMGALAVSLILTIKPIQSRAGLRMLTCVAIFGVATVVFGLSRNLLVSIVALVAIGASDMVSVVIRSSVLQLATPPEMRGRVSAVNWLFVGASNEFGEFESGLTAHWFGVVRAVVFGGIGSLLVTAGASVLFPKLRQADQLTAESLMESNWEQSIAEPAD